MATQSNLNFFALLDVVDAELTKLMKELQVSGLKAAESEEIAPVDSDGRRNGTSSEAVTSRESRSNKRTLQHRECSRSRGVFTIMAAQSNQNIECLMLLAHAAESEGIATVDSDDRTNRTRSKATRDSRSNKRKFEHEECSSSRLISKKSTKKVAPKKKSHPLCFLVPHLPDSYKHFIKGVGGTDVILVMQKKLFQTDVKPNNGRLSIPLSKVRQEFLREQEKKLLKDQFDKTVSMIQPSLKEISITLRQWDMKKKESGKGSSTYVLKSQWNKVIKDNQLKANDVIQIWSFRVREELRLALVCVERECYDNGPTGWGGRKKRSRRK